MDVKLYKPYLNSSYKEAGFEIHGTSIGAADDVLTRKCHFRDDHDEMFKPR